MTVLDSDQKYQVNHFLGPKVASDVSLGDRLIVKAGQHTTAGGAASEAVTITGLTTDMYVVATLADNGTNNVTLTTAAVTADTMTLVFSADPGNDAKVNYVIFRAV